jgi:3-hydroxybutyryl-CoA dehydrogenase
MEKIGIVGAGTMGAGIAQVVSTCGYEVFLWDDHPKALVGADEKVKKILSRLIEKGKLNRGSCDDILGRLHFLNWSTKGLPSELADCELVVEAIVEDLEAKRTLFARLEHTVSKECILVTNTSSISITSIASACRNPERVLGLHFFNPAPVMPLVELIPGIRTSKDVVARVKELVRSWDKTVVQAKDTPGFIVNRIVRPFYGEALRIYDEGIADFSTIDWAMKTLGKFPMGPFALIDLIGNDINYAVTQSIYQETYYDPRYKPSITQKRYVQAGLLGQKTGQGFYDYREGAKNPEPNCDEALGNEILFRILVMLINEAAEALHYHLANREDIDLAMSKGVNYPRGLLKWGEEIGLEKVLRYLKALYEQYGEDRYRVSPLIRQKVQDKESFYPSSWTS